MFKARSNFNLFDTSFSPSDSVRSMQSVLIIVGGFRVEGEITLVVDIINSLEVLGLIDS